MSIYNDYEREEYQYDDEPDPEQEDAADITMEEVLGPKPVSYYYSGIAPKRCVGNGGTCDAWVYESYGKWYEYNVGILHSCSKETKPATKPVFTKERTMNSIKLTQFPKSGITADSLKVGEYGRIVATAIVNGGDIVLKTNAGVINLSSPHITWNSPFDSPQVEKLNTGDRLEITVGLNGEFEKDIALLARSDKIRAIKAVREVTDWGLKEAKDYVESALLKF